MRATDSGGGARGPHGRKNAGRLVRVVIADDHDPTRFLLRTLLVLVPTLVVVGEAADGRAAVDLVLSQQADIVLLDVEMPVMGGFVAAEVIGSHRPSTRVILHTAHADPIKRAQAEALGLRLLVKQGFEETVAAVAETFDTADQDVPGPRAIEAIVLAGLAAQDGRAMVVVSAAREIPFYSAAAAELLDLPVPARQTSLEALREAHPLVDRLGQPVRRGESPLERALVNHTAETGELSEVLPDGSLRTYHVNVVPLRAPDGTFLGVGSFLTVLAESRSSRSEITSS